MLATAFPLYCAMFAEGVYAFSLCSLLQSTRKDDTKGYLGSVGQPRFGLHVDYKTLSSSLLCIGIENGLPRAIGPCARVGNGLALILLAVVRTAS